MSGLSAKARERLLYLISPIGLLHASGRSC